MLLEKVETYMCNLWTLYYIWKYAYIEWVGLEGTLKIT